MLNVLLEAYFPSYYNTFKNRPYVMFSIQCTLKKNSWFMIWLCWLSTLLFHKQSVFNIPFIQISILVIFSTLIICYNRRCKKKNWTALNKAKIFKHIYLNYNIHANLMLKVDTNINKMNMYHLYDIILSVLNLWIVFTVPILSIYKYYKYTSCLLLNIMVKNCSKFDVIKFIFELSLKH